MAFGKILAEKQHKYYSFDLFDLIISFFFKVLVKIFLNYYQCLRNGEINSIPSWLYWPTKAKDRNSPDCETEKNSFTDTLIS